jgi:hypothetical protein
MNEWTNEWMNDQVADAEKRLSGYFGYRAKFKYVTGSTTKLEHCLHNLWTELTPSDGALVAVVSDTAVDTAAVVALPWQSASAGPIYVASLENAGKVRDAKYYTTLSCVACFFALLGMYSVYWAALIAFVATARSTPIVLQVN